MTRRTPPRVFIGFSEVAGYYRGLERGLRALGVPVRFHDLSENLFGYGATRTPKPEVPFRSFKPTDRRFWAQLGRAVRRRAWRAVRRTALFPWALLRYDVFVFSGPDSFFSYRELPLLRRLGKRVVYVFNGSDHRPPYLNGRILRQAERSGPGWLAAETAKLKRRVQVVEANADAIVALSSSAQFHRRPFIHYLALGMAGDFPEVAVPATAAAWDGEGVRVLHSPSEPVSKGTAEVRAAVSAVRGRGHRIAYLELVGRPNVEVLARIQECDLVVDEVYSDTPLAGLGTEAAWFGKPTLVTGYYAREMTDIPADVIPPSLFLPPDQLTDGLERLVADPEARLALGRDARAYVRTRWTAAAVAERFLAILDGAAPAAWSYDPARLTYVHGWGMPEELLRAGLRRLIDHDGRDALHVDNAALRDRIVELVDRPSGSLGVVHEEDVQP